MKNNSWLQKGLEEIRLKHWFDGYQMLLGAHQRALRSNNPEGAVKIISEALPLLTSEKQEKLACDLISKVIVSIQRNPTERSWIELIPVSFNELVKSSLNECISTICNKIILENTFQDSEFLQHINNIILERKFGDIIIPHLYYCHAGIFCRKKDFVSAFESLMSWSKEYSHLTAKLRAYLVLAEINAYEINGLAKYLKDEEFDDRNSELLDSESKTYLDIANKIFRAVKVMDRDEFEVVKREYSDIINSKVDGLLKALCDGISEILKDEPDSGLFSLFRK